MLFLSLSHIQVISVHLENKKWSYFWSEIICALVLHIYLYFYLFYSPFKVYSVSVDIC